MVRIVAGTAGGRVLRVPKSGTRPTAERVREALFSRLEHLGYVRDCRILDLYAGSGAFGLEAASRGAKKVVCVEANENAVRVIQDNLLSTNLTAQVVKQKVESYLSVPATEKFDVIFLDPPYELADDELSAVLKLAVNSLLDDGIIVVERDKKSPEPSWGSALVLTDVRKWGDTRVWSAAFADFSI